MVIFGRLRDHILEDWPWWALNAAALAVLVAVVEMRPPPGTSYYLSNPVFEQAGRWAMRFLILCLAMTPAYLLFGWRRALPLRKPAGLWAFGFAALHLSQFLAGGVVGPVLLEYLAQPHILYAVCAFAILCALALTSNRRAMRRLGKRWKTLHRAVYIAAPLAFMHGIIALGMGKKTAVRGEWGKDELMLYLLLLIALLALRLPPVRRLLGRPLGKRKPLEYA